MVDQTLIIKGVATYLKVSIKLHIASPVKEGFRASRLVAHGVLNENI